jgi:uncharacterized protein
MAKVRFEWDGDKNYENKKKHSISFELAQYAFVDPKRVIAEDMKHSRGENAIIVFVRLIMVY